jgi:hypothetical protein
MHYLYQNKVRELTEILQNRRYIILTSLLFKWNASHYLTTFSSLCLPFPKLEVVVCGYVSCGAL